LRFPTRDVFSETTKVTFKDGSRRSVVRQKAAGTVGKYASETGIPRTENAKNDPTPKRYQVEPGSIRESGSPLGIIGYLAKDADQRAIRRLKQVGRVQYASELATKDRAAIVPLFETPPVSVNSAGVTYVSNKPKLRLIEGIRNGKFNHPGTINPVVYGRDVHRPDRGHSHDVRQGYRTTGKSSS
jgi:hypothetical protein